MELDDRLRTTKQEEDAKDQTDDNRDPIAQPIEHHVHPEQTILGQVLGKERNETDVARDASRARRKQKRRKVNQDRAEQAFVHVNVHAHAVQDGEHSQIMGDEGQYRQYDDSEDREKGLVDGADALVGTVHPSLERGFQIKTLAERDSPADAPIKPDDPPAMPEQAGRDGDEQEPARNGRGDEEWQKVITSQEIRLADHKAQEGGRQEEEKEIQHGGHDKKHAARLPFHPGEVQHVIADGLPSKQGSRRDERISTADENRLKGRSQRNPLPDGTGKKLVAEPSCQHAQGKEGNEKHKATAASGLGEDQLELRKDLMNMYIVAMAN